MNIKERITLIKAGYSKDEINSMIDEEKAPAAEAPAEQNDADAPDFMGVITKLAEEVNSMKKAMQSENLRTTELRGDTTKDSIDDILKSLINPQEKKEN